MIKLHSVNFNYDGDRYDDLKVVKQLDGSFEISIVDDKDIVDDGTLIVIKPNKGGLPDVEVLGSALINERIG